MHGQRTVQGTGTPAQQARWRWRCPVKLAGGQGKEHRRRHRQASTGSGPCRARPICIYASPCPQRMEDQPGGPESAPHSAHACVHQLRAHGMAGGRGRKGGGGLHPCRGDGATHMPTRWRRPAFMAEAVARDSTSLTPAYTTAGGGVATVHGSRHTAQPHAEAAMRDPWASAGREQNIKAAHPPQHHRGGGVEEALPTAAPSAVRR